MTDKVVQEIRKAVEWVNPRQYVLLWYDEESGRGVSEAWVHDALSYLLTELDTANEHIEQLQQKLDEVTERSMKRKYEVEELRNKAKRLQDANDDLYENREKWRESHGQLQIELDAAKQDKDEIQADIAVLKFAHKEEVRRRQQQLKQAIHPLKEAHRLLELHRTAEAHATLTAAVNTVVEQVEKENTHEK